MQLYSRNENKLRKNAGIGNIQNKEKIRYRALKYQPVSRFSAHEVNLLSYRARRLTFLSSVHLSRSPKISTFAKYKGGRGGYPLMLSYLISKINNS